MNDGCMGWQQHSWGSCDSGGFLYTCVTNAEANRKCKTDSVITHLKFNRNVHACIMKHTHAHTCRCSAELQLQASLLEVTKLQLFNLLRDGSLEAFINCERMVFRYDLQRSQHLFLAWWNIKDVIHKYLSSQLINFLHILSLRIFACQTLMWQSTIPGSCVVVYQVSVCDCVYVHGVDMMQQHMRGRSREENQEAAAIVECLSLRMQCFRSTISLAFAWLILVCDCLFSHRVFFPPTLFSWRSFSPSLSPAAALTPLVSSPAPVTVCLMLSPFTMPSSQS